MYNTIKKFFKVLLLGGIVDVDQCQDCEIVKYLRRTLTHDDDKLNILTGT